MGKKTKPEQSKRGLRLELVPVAALLLYWTVDLSGKRFFGPEFPVGPWIYASMRNLLGYAVPEALLTIGVIGFAASYLKWNGREDFGFESTGIRKQVLVGLALGLATFIGITALESVGAQVLPPEPPSPFVPLLSDRRNIAGWLFLVLFCGGVVEELERVFVLGSFEKAWGGPGVAAGLLLGSIFFGAGHLNQGIGAAISTALLGAIYGYVFIRRRRILEIIVAHAFYDVAGVLASYFLYAKGA